MGVDHHAGETMSTIFDLLPILRTNLEAGQYKFEAMNLNPIGIPYRSV
jgi:hypothetical protein